MSIFAFGVKNVLFCLHLFHEISPFSDLFYTYLFYLVIYLIWLFEHTEYVNLYCPFKRLGLVLLASPFSLQSAVANLLLTLAFSPPFTRNCFVAFAARRVV